MLSVIALKPVLSPATVVKAQFNPDLQFATYAGQSYFFNSRTGDLWIYFPNGTLSDHLRLNRPGDPITKVH